MTELQEPAAPPPPPAPPASSRRPLLGWLALIALVASAVLGSNMFSLRDRLFGSAIPEAAAPAVPAMVSARQTPPQARPSALDATSVCVEFARAAASNLSLEEQTQLADLLRKALGEPTPRRHNQRPTAVKR